ncbi:MAG: tRNA adenosine(34) deaminase TadA [Lachnospirales bacterium]
MKKDLHYYMELALKEGEKALKENEIPIGCIIVHNDEIIGCGYNRRNGEKNTLYHAEIIAMDMACKNIGDWRLEDCTMYVTVEPCPMCAGAILQSRLTTLVFGAFNKKAGCCGSVYNLLDEPRFNHTVEIVSGILEEKAQVLMSTFFKSLREDKKDKS